MESRSMCLVAVCILLQLLTKSRGFNIDTREPITRAIPSAYSQQVDALFGYSLVLHQVGDVPDRQRGDALSNTRIVVSAPRLTVDGSPVQNTGAVFTCLVEMGECSGLMGSGSGSDLRLFDSAGDDDSVMEHKNDQFLGGSMASNEDSFIVCAHRFANQRDVDLAVPVGRCYATTNQELRDFQTLEPCPVLNSDSYSFGSAGSCLAGISAVITRNNGQYTFGLGAPGYFGLRGAAISIDPAGRERRQGQSSDRDSYQGYTITAGNFRSTSTQDFAVSVPKMANYFGIVNIVTNADTLSINPQPDLRGQQMGEYYGFSLLRANLNGDGFDELLVGAPMYRANATEPETGRVYVYSNMPAGNNQRVFRMSQIIEGFNSFSRFGFAMANLGDINNDEFDDIAISAPFTSPFLDASGTVYIYHSSGTTQLLTPNPQLLTPNPQQVIVGSELSLTRDLSLLRGFGTSLASGVDVDENGYNDLAIGSFLSQEVFLLRTRPLAEVTLDLAADTQVVDLISTTCDLDGTSYSCFDVTACARYEGEGLQNTINFTVTVTADANNVERRVTFDILNNPSVTRTVTITRDGDISDSCVMLRAYILNGITDVFNPFCIDFSVEIPEVNIATQDGNPIPSDFSVIPVMSTLGTSEVSVQISNDCIGVCVPNLGIELTGSRTVMTDGSETRVMIDGTEIVPPTTITLGAVRSIIIETLVVNRGESAFRASITVSAPTSRLEINRLSGSLNNGNPVSLLCPPEQRVTDGDLTRMTCIIGNTLAAGNFTSVSTTIFPRPGLLGNEADITVDFTVGSANPETDDVARSNNDASTIVGIRAEADVTLDPVGLTTPEQISYSNNATSESIENVTQLGPSFTTSFVVRNSGPSTVGNVTITINWPLRPVDTTSTYLLYPAIASVLPCTNINPDNLVIEDIMLVDDQNTQQEINEGGKRRRRRRSVSLSREKGRRLLKRQADLGADTSNTINRTLTCAMEGVGTRLSCVQIECVISNLQGGRSAQIDITGFLDERFFATGNDRFTIIPTAEVRMEDGGFIEGTTEEGKTSSAEVRVIPAVSPMTTESRPVPWWAIFLPILAAVIIIAIVAGALWGLGFFRRRKHEELQQRKEELDNLAKNGSGPGMTPGTDDPAEGTNM